MWCHVTSGRPLVDQTDFILEAYSRCRKSSASRSSCDVSADTQKLLEATLSQNGLNLNKLTDARGDCGLDAILRNLERLDLPGAQDILTVLSRRGRAFALQALRLKFLIWLKQNLDHEMLPQLTVGDWMLMDGDVSHGAYLKRMRECGEWIDCPMLYGASATLQVQLVCFLAHGVPQIVVANTNRHANDLPILLLANANNTHFWAVEPSENIGTPMPSRATKGDLLSEHYSSVCTDDVSSVDFAEPSENIGTPMPIATHDVFEMAVELMEWKPFETPDVNSRVLALSVQTEEDNVANDIYTVVRWREAIKLHQWESMDRKAGIDREDQYCIARKHLATFGRTPRQASKSQKLLAKLCLANVVVSLRARCEKASKKHRCLDIFRDKPKIVLRWRRLWYALPKDDRTRRLADMFRCELGGKDAPIQFRFMGAPVCRQAFIILTGVCANHIQEARKLALGQVVQTSFGHLWVSRKPLAYLNARAWLLQYAKTHGDTSPLETNIYLPHGWKHYYYATYYKERVVQGTDPKHIAGLDRFLKMWQTELPWIGIKDSSSKFTHCGLCDYLKLMIASAQDKHVRHATTYHYYDDG